MTPMKSSSGAWKRSGNPSVGEWKGARQHYPQKGREKYSTQSARIIKQAGNYYGVAHICLIMAAGVGEVVWVRATCGLCDHPSAI